MHGANVSLSLEGLSSYAGGGVKAKVMLAAFWADAEGTSDLKVHAVFLLTLSHVSIYLLLEVNSQRAASHDTFCIFTSSHFLCRRSLDGNAQRDLAPSRRVVPPEEGPDDMQCTTCVQFIARSRLLPNRLSQYLVL